MPSTVGKINGQMLENNLLRNGVDLAFDTEKIILDNGDRVVASSAAPANLVATVSSISV